MRGIRDDMDYYYEENIAQINEEISGLDTIYVRAGTYGSISSSTVKELYKNGKRHIKIRSKRNIRNNKSPKY